MWMLCLTVGNVCVDAVFSRGYCLCGCCVQQWILFVWMLCSAVDNVCVDAVFNRR